MESINFHIQVCIYHHGFCEQGSSKWPVESQCTIIHNLVSVCSDCRCLLCGCVISKYKSFSRATSNFYLCIETGILNNMILILTITKYFPLRENEGILIHLSNPTIHRFYHYPSYLLP